MELNLSIFLVFKYLQYFKTIYKKIYAEHLKEYAHTLEKNLKKYKSNI